MPWYFLRNASNATCTVEFISVESGTVAGDLPQSCKIRLNQFSRADRGLHLKEVMQCLASWHATGYAIKKISEEIELAGIWCLPST